MGRRGDGLECRGRAQATQAHTRGGGEGLGRGVGERRQGDRLGEAHAASRLQGVAEEVGGGAYLLVVEPEQTDEQGLREAMRECGSVRVRGHDSSDGAAISMCLRLSRQFLERLYEKRSGGGDPLL